MPLRLLILLLVFASLAAAEASFPGPPPILSSGEGPGSEWEDVDESILPGPEGEDNGPHIPSGEEGGTNAAIGDTLHDFYPLYCLVSIAVGILLLITQ